MPAAHAASTVIDGPASQIRKFGGLDMAPDGTGAIAYSKQIGTDEHVFVARFTNGTWGAPVEVDGTLSPDDPTSIQVAAGNGGRVVVTYVNLAGTTSGALESAVSPSSSAGFTLAPVDTAGTAIDDDLDMDPVSGAAYVVYDTVGQHVMAQRWPGSGTAWTAVTVGANPVLDATAGTAGTGDDGSRVVVDSSGNAVLAWPEGATSTNQEAIARRVTGTSAGTPITLSATTLATHADAKETNMIDMDGGGSANPWIVFRQGFDYGGGSIVVRNIARQLVGDTPSTPQVLDGLAIDPKPSEGAEHPFVDVNAAGQGLATTSRQLSNGVFGSALSAGNWSTGFQLNSDTNNDVPLPVPAVADNGNGLIAWMDSGVDPKTAVARTRVGGVLGSQVTLSIAGKGNLGGIAGGRLIQAASSAAGLIGVGFAHGGADGGSQRTIVAAMVDLRPGGGGGGGGGGGAGPTVSSLRIKSKRFRLGTKLPHLSRSAPVGTTISFKVSEASTTTFSFARLTAGRRVGKRCLAPTRSRAHKRRCTRAVAVHPVLSFSTKAGSHTLRFQGRLSRTKRLAPGRYRLTVVSKDSAGNASKPQTLSFTLLPAH
ncbi:MAG: hypothetical protein ACXVRH_00035 [Thermoleophilaceae bacterium]